jgi:hypothetical protein
VRILKAFIASFSMIGLMAIIKALSEFKNSTLWQGLYKYLDANKKKRVICMEAKEVRKRQLI